MGRGSRDRAGLPVLLLLLLLEEEEGILEGRGDARGLRGLLLLLLTLLLREPPALKLTRSQFCLTISSAIGCGGFQFEGSSCFKLHRVGGQWPYKIDAMSELKQVFVFSAGSASQLG